MTQKEITRKEYITRLKKELYSVEGKYQQIINENCMQGEDYRVEHLRIWREREIAHSRNIKELKFIVIQKDAFIDEYLGTIVQRNEEIEQEMMRAEGLYL